MRIFAMKTVLFVTIQALLLLTILLTYQPDDHSFLAAGKDKMLRADSVPGNRLLLVGGSSVAFGFQSPLLEERLSIPVVNLGGQASQGLEYRLREALEAVHEGDTVILSLEYPLLAKPVELGLTLWRTIEVLPTAWNRMGVLALKAMADDAHLALNHVLKRVVLRFSTGQWPNPPAPYRREGFNPQGDVVDHFSMTAPGVGNGPFLVNVSRNYLDAALNRLEWFDRQCRARGANVWFFPPAIPEPRRRMAAEGVDEIQKALSERFPGKLLATPEEVAQPLEAFFNSDYHLTRDGSRENTLRLLGRLHLTQERARR